MKSLFTARNFGILLIVLVFCALGWTMVKETRPYQQAAYILQNVSQSVSLFPAQRPSTFLSNQDGLEQIQFCEDGSRLFVGSRGYISVYETGSWKQLQQWKVKLGYFFVSPNGKRLFIAKHLANPLGVDLSSWDVDSGKRLSAWSISSSRELPRYQTFSSVSPDLSQAVLVDHQRNPERGRGREYPVSSLWIVDAQNGKKLHQLTVNFPAGVTPRTRWENQMLCAGFYNEPSVRFRTKDWQPVPSLPAIPDSRFSLDGNLLVGTDNPQSLDLFPKDVTSSPPPAELVLYNPQTHSAQRLGTDLGYIREVYPAEGALVVAGLKKDSFATVNPYQAVIQIRTLDAGQVKAEIRANLMQIDDQWKLLAIEQGKNYIDIYRAANGKRLCRLDKTANPENGEWDAIDSWNWEPVKFSPDGKWCVMGNDKGQIRIWTLPAL